ncbi:MAG TPA: hypothetical protein VM369_03280 [Candidatus Binatia bacterium]|nr:hypothetical protein [Candidatus Binatia bacterium]
MRPVTATTQRPLRDCLTAREVTEFLRPVFKAVARSGLRVTSGWDHGLFSAYFFLQGHEAVPVVTWFATPTLDDPSDEALVSCVADVEIVSHRRLLVGGKPLAECTQDDLIRDLPQAVSRVAGELDREPGMASVPMHRGGGPRAPVTFAFGLHPPSGATVH